MYVLGLLKKVIQYNFQILRGRVIVKFELSLLLFNLTQFIDKLLIHMVDLIS